MKRFGEDILYIQSPKAGETAEYQAQDSMVFVVHEDDVSDIKFMQDYPNLIIKMPDDITIVIKDVYTFDEETNEWQEDKFPFILYPDGDVMDPKDIASAVIDDTYGDSNALTASAIYFDNSFSQRYELETNPLGDDIEIAEILGDTEPLFIDMEAIEQLLSADTYESKNDITEKEAILTNLSLAAVIYDEVSAPVAAEETIYDTGYDTGDFANIAMLQEVTDMVGADMWMYG